MWRMPLIGNLLILLGPTAVGKTDLAIQIAQQLNGEIIGADSRQFYKYMDIGTAKPSLEQQAAAKHYLIDFLLPDEDFALAEYQEKAYSQINEILSRGKLPMLVGGTGQYITAVEEGWSIPRVPPNMALRAEMEAEAEAIGYEAFHAKLALVDPVAAENIHPNNLRRVIRALEVYQETGTAISVLQQKQAPPYRIRTIGLKLERELLYPRADARVDTMMAEGFLEEVQRLLEMGYNPRLPAMSALGYRELIAYLHGETSLEEAITLTKNSTHDFIRKQEIWFRGHDNGILWHNSKDVVSAQVIESLAAWMRE
jgi:tRNA dimethylallyltransferase